MAISSFNTQNITEHSSAHIFRESKVNYLLDHDTDDNEYYRCHTISIDEFKKQAQESYTLHHTQNQRMQKKQFDGLIKEAVINMNKETTIEHIKELFELLRFDFKGGYQVFQIGVHNDEGVFVEYVGKNNEEWDLDDYTYDSIKMTWLDKQGKQTTNIIAHRPERDIFYNKDNETWYNDKKHEQKADMSVLKKFHNYHAHVIYSPFNLRTGKGRMRREDMRRIQTLTALELNMTRGKEASYTKRGTHWQRKQIADAVNDAKKIHLQKEKELEKQVYEKNEKTNNVLEDKKTLKKYKNNWKQTAKELRKKLQLEKAKRADYAKFEAKQKEIQILIEVNNLPYDEAIHQLTATKDEIIHNLRTPKITLKEIDDTTKDTWLDKEIEEQVKSLDIALESSKNIFNILSKYINPENEILRVKEALDSITNELNKEVATKKFSKNYSKKYDTKILLDKDLMHLKKQSEVNLDVKIEEHKIDLREYEKMLTDTHEYYLFEDNDLYSEYHQKKESCIIELKQLEEDKKRINKKKPTP